ncbi:MAG: response regulator [Planctomycetota bacterium]
MNLVHPQAGKPAQILLVDDNFDDVFLARRGFERSRFAVDIHHVVNGAECMAFLRKEGRYATAPKPDIILLDLNMPVMSGREVMEEIGADPSLRALPVVVLTTSENDLDVADMYNLRCSSYIVKPVDFEKFQQVIREFTRYWFTLVVLPHDGTPSARLA